MGVPKFFRWISERYPCLSELIQESQIPEFDNLYLDMNGIIHNCSHPNDDDVHFRISEEQIFRNIFRYIEHLFSIIKPRKTFFMAVDGVAPRAKMNQQRSRRFRTAKEAQDKESEAIRKGEVLPEERRFDSNCITPGTDFMVRLQEQLKYFVVKKISTDPLWQGKRIYLSGHQTPGEGEHKIMDFIRYLKVQPDYDPYTRHCLYGLDADLVMLGMVSHERYFSLLREEVTFVKQSKQHGKVFNPESINFFLLHLTILRDYLALEFSPLKDNIQTFEYDLDSIIDDWVLMGFLVGNDFIPHLPGFHLNKGALNIFHSLYIQILPKLGGYINNNGVLNLKRLEQFLACLGDYETKQFNSQIANLSLFSAAAGGAKKGAAAATTGGSGGGGGVGSNGATNIPTVGKSNGLKELTPFFGENDLIENDLLEGDVADVESSQPASEDSSSELDLEEGEFEAHKRAYYKEKLKIEANEDNLRDQALCYVTALQWNLYYYYRGCSSWSWFYPHHYAPYVSDIKNISLFNCQSFELSTPLKPYEQLLGVLPIASKRFLPPPYQKLMEDEKSPLSGFYPTKFSVDLNEKKQAWEAVVLIPFIDEKLLLTASSLADCKLSEQEKENNAHGPHLLYTYTPDRLPAYVSSLPNAFSDIVQNFAKCEEIPLNTFHVSNEELEKPRKKCDPANLFYGFPTLDYVPYTFDIKNEKIRVFETMSREDNIVLSLLDRETENRVTFAITNIGNMVYFNWPYLKRGKLVEVYNGGQSCIKGPTGKLTFKKLDQRIQMKCAESLQKSSSYFFEKRGIRIDDSKIVLAIEPFSGNYFQVSKDKKLTVTSVYSQQQIFCPISTVVFDLKIKPEPSLLSFGLKSAFPEGAKCFLLQKNYYAEMAEICCLNEKARQITVQFTLSEEPDLNELISRQQEIFYDNYMVSNSMAKYVGLNVRQLYRLVGVIWVKEGRTLAGGKVNLGFSLTSGSLNQEIPNYSRKIDNQWLFSNKVANCIQEYQQKFPKLLERIFQVDKDIYDLEDLFDGPDAKKQLKEVRDWVKSQPFYGVQPQKIGTKSLDACIVNEIKAFLDSSEFFFEEQSPTKMNFNVDQVFCPNSENVRFAPDPNAKFDLFDRVVNVRPNHVVPFGLKGVIIAQLPDVKPSDQFDPIFTIIFDQEFEGAMKINCDSSRTYNLPASSLLNISFGRKRKSNQPNFGIMELNLPPVRSGLGMKETFLSQKHIEKMLTNNQPNYWEDMNKRNQHSNFGNNNATNSNNYAGAAGGSSNRNTPTTPTHHHNHHGNNKNVALENIERMPSSSSHSIFAKGPSSYAKKSAFERLKPPTVANHQNGSSNNNSKVSEKSTKHTNSYRQPRFFCKLLDDFYQRTQGQTPVYLIKRRNKIPYVQIAIGPELESLFETPIKDHVPAHSSYNYAAKLLLEKLKVYNCCTAPNFLLEANSYNDLPFVLPTPPSDWL